MSLPVHLTSFTIIVFFFFFNDTATTEIYTLSLHDALPISHVVAVGRHAVGDRAGAQLVRGERVDHAMGLGHATNPAVGFDGHGAPIYRRRRHLRHSIRLTTSPRANTFRRIK